MLDVAPITIGAACQIATRVQLLTAAHPIDPDPRRAGWEYGEPITLGDNVWLGGGVIVCPGVPARVLREIGAQDQIEVPTAPVKGQPSCSASPTMKPSGPRMKQSR